MLGLAGLIAMGVRAHLADKRAQVARAQLEEQEARWNEEDAKQKAALAAKQKELVTGKEAYFEMADVKRKAEKARHTAEQRNAQLRTSLRKAKRKRVLLDKRAETIAKREAKALAKLAVVRRKAEAASRSAERERDPIASARAFWDVAVGTGNSECDLVLPGTTRSSTAIPLISSKTL